MTRMHYLVGVVALSTSCVPPNSLMDTSHPHVTAFREKSRAVGASQLGTPSATTIYNFMTSTDHQEEAFWDYLMDEASIASITDTEVCFAFTVRTEFQDDVHPSQWELQLDGVPFQAEETTPYQDVRYPTKQITRTLRDGTTIVSEKSQGGYTTRHAGACGPRPVGARALHLQLALPQSDSSIKWGQRFTWLLGSPAPARTPSSAPGTTPALTSQT